MQGGGMSMIVMMLAMFAAAVENDCVGAVISTPS